MSDAHHPKVDISKYFNHKQKVFLINVSENRDQELYESLSATVVGRGRNSIALQIPYSTEYTSPLNGSLKPSFKLTTEALGNGIQVVADLIRVGTGNIFHLELHGSLEMYQRHRPPRIDTTIKLFQIQSNISLDIYRKEFRKITGMMKNHGLPFPTLRCGKR